MKPHTVTAIYKFIYLISIIFDHTNCVDSETEPRIERGVDDAIHLPIILLYVQYQNFIILNTPVIGLFLKYFFEYCTVLYITIWKSLI